MDEVKEPTAEQPKAAKVEAPKVKAPPLASSGSETKRKLNKRGLVTVRYLGERFTPMKYEVYVGGSMVKLTFGKSSPTAEVTPAVADVLTGKTKVKYDDKDRPVDAVVVVGKLSKESAATERFEEVV